jgi:hypothetical protein
MTRRERSFRRAESFWRLRQACGGGSVFCTTVIPTIGRATLERAVLSVLDQAFQGAAF